MPFDAGGFVVVESEKGHSNPMIPFSFLLSLNLRREYLSRVDFFVSSPVNVKRFIFDARNESLWVNDFLLYNFYQRKQIFVSDLHRLVCERTMTPVIKQFNQTEI